MYDRIVWSGWAAAGFAFVYGLLSPKATAFLPYLIVGILPIILPYLFIKSYDYWINIPPLKYRKWQYKSQVSLPVLEPINVIKVNIQFTKIPDESDPVFEGYWVELPSEKDLGTLFHYFIYSHNNRHREHKKDPIHVETGGKKLGWLLYKQNTLEQRIYLNTDLSLTQNNIMNNETIFAQSYSN
ncbi:TssN family type VI secretion system protein [Runella rosea]|uniref:TssN family type VI secretion system protein n=1 Tax=Runella rosea TaxID=2259595 RepID=UPI0013B43C0D|nr:TssN family type VI secretion system protein [Runella rosea]